MIRYAVQIAPLLVAVMAPTSAAAYTCESSYIKKQCTNTCVVPPGDSLEFSFFHPPSNTTYPGLKRFPAPRRNMILDGAAAWGAGDDRPIQSASWEYLQGDDILDAPAQQPVFLFADSKNSVIQGTEDGLQQWMGATLTDNAKASAFLEVNVVHGTCVIAEADVFFLHDPGNGKSWSKFPPSEAVSSQMSLPMFSAHEFGHVLGLGHEEDEIATLNSLYPFGGDAGKKVRVHANGIEFMLDKKWDYSPTVNFQLSKFVQNPAQAGWLVRRAVETWNYEDPWDEPAFEDTWETCPGECLQYDLCTPPVTVGVHAEYSAGPPTLQAMVRFGFYVDVFDDVPSSCDEYEGSHIVQTSIVTLARGTPRYVDIDWADPSVGIPEEAEIGSAYVMCADISAVPGSPIPIELASSKGDNVVESERILTVDDELIDCGEI